MRGFVWFHSFSMIASMISTCSSSRQSIMSSSSSILTTSFCRIFPAIYLLEKNVVFEHRISQSLQIILNSMRIRLICLAKVLCFLPSLLAISRSEMTPSCTQIINILSASASNSRSRPITRESNCFPHSADRWDNHCSDQIIQITAIFIFLIQRQSICYSVRTIQTTAITSSDGCVGAATVSMILLVFANAGSFSCETGVQNFINQIVLLCLRVVDLFHVLSFPPEKETTGSARSEDKSAHRERLSPIRQSNGNMPALRYETSCALYVHSGLFMMITFGRRLFACIFL